MSEQRNKPTFQRRIARVLTACWLTSIFFAQNSEGNTTALESLLHSDSAFSLFAHAMDSANFWERLAKEDSVTVFVPTNSALESEGSDFLLKSVLVSKENKERLKDLISGHITTELIATDVSGLDFVQTLNNQCLLITRVGDAMKVGSEAFVLFSKEIGTIRIIAIDRLLISGYRESGNC